MSGEESQPNIVLVSADSLRADHCGYINSDSELTPTIDRLAEEGTAFAQAVAPGPERHRRFPSYSLASSPPSTKTGGWVNGKHANPVSRTIWSSSGI